MQQSVNNASVALAPGSFLTEAQREALDAALKEKEAENAAKAREHAAHQHKAAGGTSDRKSRSTKGSGAPKKHGGGGKYTWGALLTDGDQSERVLDKNDPNYDSEEERSNTVRTQHDRLKEEVAAYKAQVQSIVEEYFCSGDIGDVAESLEDLGVPGYMHYFVKRLLTCALDRNNREREMASVALSSLYAVVVPPEQVQKGFFSLIDSIGDLVLDVPDAPELLAMFIARAVVDDVLPPAAAHRVPDGPANSPAAQLKHKVESLMSARHGAEKVLRCWGSGAGVSYQDTKDSISRLLTEFCDSKDVGEASRCLHSLNVPFFHHEVVKQAIHRAMEASSSNTAQATALVNLLARLAETGEISLAQLHKGLARVGDTLEDLSLDNPSAKEQHAAVMEMAKQAGLFSLDEANSLAALARRTSDMSLQNGNGAASTSGQPYHGGVAAFKAASRLALEEYFDASDAQEVARRLVELGEPGLVPLFVKLAVVMALDRKSRERELVSKLLSDLHPDVLTDDIAAAGFTRLLNAADDLVLDCPDAVHLLSLFLGRAIVDEVLPPAFLTSVLKGLSAGSLGISVVRGAGALLSARHGAERLVNAWSGGALTVEQVRSQMQGLLDEYRAGAHDAAEAARCLKELGVPYYHHEAVVRTVEMAFAQGKESEAAALLASLSSMGIINQTQMTKGFARVKANLGDEALDFGPAARGVFDRLVAAGTSAGWLFME